MEATGRACRKLLVLFVAVLGLGLGCSSDDTSSPVLVSISLEGFTGFPVGTITVKLDRAAAIEVDYSTDGKPLLRVASAPAVTHRVQLARLAADRVYDYRVRAVATDDGEVVAQGSFTTGPLPEALASARLLTSGTASIELLLLTYRSDTFNGFVITDADGDIVWWFETGDRPSSIEPRPNGNFVFLTRGVGLSEVSLDAEIVAMQPSTSPETPFHHDIAVTPAGTVLALSRKSVDVGFGPIIVDVIVEWDSDAGTLIERWNSADFLDPNTDIGQRSSPNDWFHANSINIGPRGNLLVSFRYIDQIVSIASNFQSLEWRLGGPQSSFELVGDAEFLAQHGATEPSENRVLLFDNHTITNAEGDWEFPAGTTTSRAVEVELDRDSGQARLVWEFRPPVPATAFSNSTAFRLGNGNTIVTFGSPTVEQIAVYEASDEEAVLWELSLPDASSMPVAFPLESMAGEQVVVGNAP